MRSNAGRRATRADPALASDEDAQPPPDDLDIAVRAYAVKVKQKAPWQGDAKHPGLSQYSLVFDTETVPDAAQQLRVGAYHWRKQDKLVQAGLFYDPASLAEGELEVIRAYSTDHDLAEPITDRAFVVDVFFGMAYELNATIVAFNAPFDISRLAIGHDSARGNMRGGFTFRLSADPDWPNIRVRHLGSRAALISFTARPGQRAPRSMRKKKRKVPTRRGYFLDVRTAASALLGGSYSLRTLAEALKTKTRKIDVADYSEPITPEYLDYLLTDVQVTWECNEILAERYRSYRLTKTRLPGVYSEAGIGKACLKEMNVQPWREVQPEFPPELLGIIMSTYHGGRSEVRMRRQVCRVLYLDFLSQFSTSAVLQGLWAFVRAQGVEWEEATEEVRVLLGAVQVPDLQDREIWKELPALVQVRPKGDLFPVRTKYETVTEDGDIIQDAQYTTGLNYLSSEQPLWFTLADCIASKLLTGRVPEVLRAIRFGPGPAQEGLAEIDLLGKPDHHIDPGSEDFYQRLIELRLETKRQLDQARAAGNELLAQVLDAEQLALKTTASASAYGIYVELNVDYYDKLQELICYGYEGEAFPAWEHNVEKPGTYFHPLVATLITGGSRLMLAITERLAGQEKLEWAFCDTDSMALAAPPGISEPYFLTRAEQVRSWFDPLNPYPDAREPLLQVKEENFGLVKGKPSKELAELWCFAVSAKRHCLVNIVRGRPVIRKASAHGLGHLIAPYKPENAPRTIPVPLVPLEELEVERWEYDLWYRIVQAALSNRPDRVDTKNLPRFDQPAVARYAANTPRLLSWFKKHATGKKYREQVRPFGFLLAYQPDPSKFKGEELPRVVSPYDKDLDVAVSQCFDRETGRTVDKGELRTYRRALAQYHLNPERKFHHADYTDSGTTERREIHVRTVQHIGKEANRWEDQFFLGYDPEAQVDYGPKPDTYRSLRAQALKGCEPFGVMEVSRAAAVSHGVVSEFLRGKVHPSVQTLNKILAALPQLDEARQHQEAAAEVTLDAARRRAAEGGLGLSAGLVDVDPGYLSRVLRGKQRPSKKLLVRLDTFLRSILLL